MKPPIADPFQSSPPKDPTRRYFAYNLWRAAVGTVPAAFVGDLIIAAFIPSRSGDRIFTVLFMALCAIIVLSALSLLLLSVWTSKNYLKAPSLAGLSREVEWSQINRARVLWIGWPYLVISTHKKRNIIWIPLFLRDMNGFARAVEEWAPDDNPLRLFLKQRGF